MNIKKIDALLKKGVNIPNPATVFIGDDVDIERISPEGVTLFSGTKLTGAQTLIMPGSVLGYETPVTVENCLMGPATKLHGGYFQDTVFMGDNVFGSGGHVRKGCILEEQANAAHTVGLKQTILFPFVTLGSLINFCDCLMAGGTSRKDHSEVGSSFIHFNYTPNQDKATPSMMGNVYQGVMLNQRPVFLGGQGGLVGPVRIAFGCISAAGSIIRNSELRCDRLIMGGTMRSGSVQWRPGIYTRPDRILTENIYYISGLYALKVWYRFIRPLFTWDWMSQALVSGLQKNIDLCIQERIKRLDAFGDKLKQSKQILLQREKGQGSQAVAVHEIVLEKLSQASSIFDQAENDLKTPGPDGEQFIRHIDTNISHNKKDYVGFIQGLDESISIMGSTWLKGIEDRIVGLFGLDV
ncbi:MAG: protein GlmU [Desulfobacter postgatei]|uniref:protein GlmU n=1 Tax=Desulfobacter postgatei TaxID=2293 RepID=UPI0023F305A1|nr:protein GlmU [Desulfobacter postgatei]MDD4274666.1 protein GlmU [Desulfobacter postgatei]